MSDARRGLESQAHSVPKGRGLRCDILQEPSALPFGDVYNIIIKYLWGSSQQALF